MGLKRKKDLKNPRYVGQRDGISCGPLAILNILKWAGYAITSNYLKNLRKYCKTDKDGTDTKYISKVLNRYSKLEYKCIPFVKINDLHKHLENEGSAIIEVSWFNEDINDSAGHFYVIIGVIEIDNKTFYKVINWKKGFTQNFAERKVIIKEFRKCMKSEENPKAWLIKRKI